VPSAPRENVAPCLVRIEACATSRPWSREICGTLPDRAAADATGLVRGSASISFHELDACLAFWRPLPQRAKMNLSATDASSIETGSDIQPFFVNLQ